MTDSLLYSLEFISDIVSCKHRKQAQTPYPLCQAPLWNYGSAVQTGFLTGPSGEDVKAFNVREETQVFQLGVSDFAYYEKR